jgi:sulfatase maturation enzyme AslB (radical SAM superfamily)
MTCAFVKATALREVWFHTGTACNLECPFCLEGSKPGDNRLERVTLTDLKPFFDEAVTLDVERFAFTGGEPLIVKDIVKILSYALERKPCLILTNGTAPLIKRVHQLQLLKQLPHMLSFRVSIDHPNEKLHDAERGWGNFRRAMDGIRLLYNAGFDVSIARHAKFNEDTRGVNARYSELLRKHDLPQDLKLAPLPELGRPGVQSNAILTQADLTNSSHPLMCATSRMVLKRDGQMRVYACALTDDDNRFDLAPSLAGSLTQNTSLGHQRCEQCVRIGVSLG